jgi:PAS domain S-box-containing protein
MEVRPDASLHFTFVSKGIETLFGVSQAEVCRDAAIMTNCIVEEDRPAHLEYFCTATTNLQPRFSEFRILSTGGQLKWIRGRALPKRQPDGSVIWSGILVDITEHKTLEAAFQKAQQTAALAEAVISSQEQLRTLIEAMPDAVFFKDGWGLWQITNKVAINLFGLRGVPWEGKSERELMVLCPGHAKAFEACFESDERAWKSEGTFHSEELILPQSHPRLDLHLTKVPLFNEDGSRKGLVVTGRNITAQKQMEEKLWNHSLHTEEMIERERASIARDLHDDLGQTMTTLSFEVKRLQNLLSGTVPEVKENIAALFEYIDSMTTSIHRIRTTLKPLLLDELGLVASIELLAEQLSEKSGILIDVDCPCLLCRCVEDSLHVFKIAHEVLANCVKHSQATHVIIACVKLPNECLLEISDNGTGFVYPDASNIKSFGLVGMKERAELLGARLDIRSVVNKGTVVSLYIPCKQEKGAANAISHSR